MQVCKGPQRPDPDREANENLPRRHGSTEFFSLTSTDWADYQFQARLCRPRGYASSLKRCKLLRASVSPWWKFHEMQVREEPQRPSPDARQMKIHHGDKELAWPC